MPFTAPQKSIITNKLWPLLTARTYPKTICPSEVARAFTTQELTQLGAANWRETMAPVREVVFELRKEGELEVLQKGSVIGEDVELEDVVGPIRVRGVQK